MKLKACLLAVALCFSSTAFAVAPKTSDEDVPQFETEIQVPVEVLTDNIKLMAAHNNEYYLKSASSNVLMYETNSRSTRFDEYFLMYLSDAEQKGKAYSKVLSRITFKILPGKAEGSSKLVCIGQQVYNPDTATELVISNNRVDTTWWWLFERSTMNHIKRLIEAKQQQGVLSVK